MCISSPSASFSTLTLKPPNPNGTPPTPLSLTFHSSFIPFSKAPISKPSLRLPSSDSTPLPIITSSMEAGIGVTGTKLGMMSYFEPSGTVVPVTVIGFREGKIFTQVKTEATDGYSAVQVGYRRVRDRKLTKPEMGHLEKSGIIPLRHLQEFRLQNVEGFEHNQRLVFDELFTEGDLVDVSGTTIGKGFQGMADDRRSETSEARELAVIPARYQGPRCRPLARYRPQPGHPYSCFSPARRVRPSCGCWRMYSYPDYVVVPLIEDNRSLVRFATSARESIHGMREDLRRQARRMRELEAQLAAERERTLAVTQQLHASRSRYTRIVRYIRDSMSQVLREGTQMIDRVLGEIREEVPVGAGPAAPAPPVSEDEHEEDMEEAGED